jgi:hypothetical protein
MLLSYWLRLVCRVLFTVGIIQVTLHLLMQLLMTLAERMVDQMSARFQERIYHLPTKRVASVARVGEHICADGYPLLAVAGLWQAHAFYSISLPHRSMRWPSTCYIKGRLPG